MLRSHPSVSKVTRITVAAVGCELSDVASVVDNKENSTPSHTLLHINTNIKHMEEAQHYYFSGQRTPESFLAILDADTAPERLQ